MNFDMDTTWLSDGHLNGFYGQVLMVISTGTLKRLALFGHRPPLSG